LARGLRLQQSSTIGLIIPNLTNPVYAEIARGMEGVCTQAGYLVLLGDSGRDPVPEKKLVQMLWAKQVADTLQIGELLSRRPRALSGGQRQRVALARAIVRNPAAFLMDEPLSNLDAKLRVHMRAELKHLQRSLGTTTLYVTHDQAGAMTMADRVAILRQGVLQQVDSPDDIYYHPVNTFVAGFVGSPAMNMVNVEFDPDTKHFVREPDFRYAARPFLERFRFDGHQAGRYVLGVRPENVSVSLEEIPGGVAGRIFALEPMGNETLVAMDVGDLRIIAREAPLFEADIQSTCWLKSNDQLMHLFDEETEERLVEK
jgi:multiple sugar transport system ATP-binding protein